MQAKLRDFDELGVLLCAGLPNETALKKFIDTVAAMGYTTLWFDVSSFLYIDGEPEYCVSTEKITRQQFGEMDAYCRARGLKLVPSVQTLGHMGHIAGNPAYADIIDRGEVLLVDEPRTYEFLDRLFGTLAETFSSHEVNLGLDETHDLGLGKYLTRHGFCEEGALYMRHLHRLKELADKHGLKCNMWGDMLKKFKRDYNAGSKVCTRDYTLDMPDGITAYEWIYDIYPLEELDEILDLFGNVKDLGYAVTAWNFTDFAAHNAYCIEGYKNHLEICRRRNIRKLVVTIWSDSGNEASLFSVLPALYACAAMARGETDFDRFGVITGVPFDTFMLADLPNLNRSARSMNAKCRFYFYDDVLGGRYDELVSDGLRERYEQAADTLAAADGGEYGYLFTTLEKLCRVLAFKSALGRDLKAAYRAGDCAALKDRRADIPEILRRIDAFADAFRAQWAHERRQLGYAVHAERIGRLKAALSYAYDLIGDYLAGRVPAIEAYDLPDVPKVRDSWCFQGPPTDDNVL